MNSGDDWHQFQTEIRETPAAEADSGQAQPPGEFGQDYPVPPVHAGETGPIVTRGPSCGGGRRGTG